MVDVNFSVKNTLQVNSTFIANSSTISFGFVNATANGVLITPNSITLGNSSVNNSINATVFTGTSNNALYLNGVSVTSYVNTSGSFTYTNVQTYSSNVVLNGGLIANGSQGSNGQILFSNGTTSYWSDPVSGAIDKERVVTASTSNIVVDFSSPSDKANFIKMTIASSTTINFTNFPTASQNNAFSWTLMTVNDSTAGRAVAFGNPIKWAGGILPPRTTNANAIDIWSFFYESNTIYGSLSIANAS